MRVTVTTVDVHTTDLNMDPSRVADALIEAGYLVDSVNINDGERTWQVES